MPDDPNAGDFIVLFDSDSDNAAEPPILLVRVTEDGYEGIGEGWIDHAERLEARAPSSRTRPGAERGGSRRWVHPARRTDQPRRVLSRRWQWHGHRLARHQDVTPRVRLLQT